MAILECTALCRDYGDRRALDGVSLTVEAGHIVGLLGPNGSGKTTLMKLAVGMLAPTGGEIRIDGKAPSRETKAQVSYLPERDPFDGWMRPRQLLKLYGDFFTDFDCAQARELLQHLGIPAEQPLRHMSKGMREKVRLVLAMSRRAKLYLLDEPLGGVDPAARDLILTTIIRSYDPAAAVVISTHLIADVEKVLDDVVFLQNGAVALQASVDEVRAQRGSSVDGVFREVFQCSGNS